MDQRFCSQEDRPDTSKPVTQADHIDHLIQINAIIRMVDIFDFHDLSVWERFHVRAASDPVGISRKEQALDA